jgi:hypothetical protein
MNLNNSNSDKTDVINNNNNNVKSQHQNKYTCSIDKMVHSKMAHTKVADTMSFPPLKESLKATTPNANKIPALNFQHIIEKQKKDEQEQQQQQEQEQQSNANEDEEDYEEDYKICLEHRIKRTLKNKLSTE